jgi:uncharacterized protein YndB with AHSA1/START domain
MKWLMILGPLLIGLIAAVGSVALIGSLLPVGHRASRAAHLNRPRDEVWAVLTDFASHPSWRPKLRAVERLPDHEGHQVWKEIDKHGEALPIEFEVIEPPHRLIGRITDPGLPFGGTWTYELTPTEGGCTLRITEDGEVYNPIFRYVSRATGHAGTMEGYLKALGRKFDQDVTIVP